MITKDLAAFQIVGGEVHHSLADSDSNGQLLVGILKLAQRWLLEFLTEKGSMPYASDRGTTFITRLNEGKLRTEFEIVAAFNAAKNAIRRNLKSEEIGDEPLDERYAGADLVGISLEPGLLRLAVNVRSKAGNAVQVKAPLTVS